LVLLGQWYPSSQSLSVCSFQALSLIFPLWFLYWVDL
jgi:hypothetical protein